VSNTEQTTYPSTESPESSSTGSGSAAPELNTEDKKVFELHLSNTTFDHEIYLASSQTNPLHGPFTPVSPARSYFAACLDATVPPSMLAPGLLDWESDKVRWKQEAAPESGEKRDQLTTTVNAQLLVDERAKRRRDKETPRVMKGLKNLKEDSEAEAVAAS
jgi:hypothetical protein